MIEYIGLWVLIALTVNMWVLLSVLFMPVPVLIRALWAVLLLVPVLGFVLWYLFGPRGRTA